MSNAVALKPSTTPAQSSAAPASERAMLLSMGLVPRAARIPSDLAALETPGLDCPMAITLRHMGGQARVDRAAAHHIRTLITSALKGE